MRRFTLFSKSLLKSIGFFLLFAGALQSSWAQTEATISGKIKNLSNEGLEEAFIEVTGDTNGSPFQVEYLIPFNGEYHITLPIGGNYTIRPVKDDNPLNGVSTYDLVLMSKHILGIQNFDSPYKYIAADINKDGVISLADSSELRKLILGIYLELPNNSSWRFVRSDYVFPNPVDPLNPPFPETFTVNNLTADINNIDFFGVKVGDLNENAIGGGQLYSRYIQGTVRWDQNNNCSADAAEPGLENWKLTAFNNQDTYNGKSFVNGVFALNVPPGVYDVVLTPPNSLWDACIDTIFGVNVLSANVDSVDFLGQAAISCPSLEVQLSSLGLRRCFSNNYYVVNYCNNGTVTAEDAYVTVDFDPYLEVESSSIPASSINGNTYTFQVGDIPAGQCGSFNVKLYVSCDAVLGQTHCSTAHIYPDSICDPQLQGPWDGSNLVITGNCDNGVATFTITNTGQNMTQGVNYVIYEDIMLMMSNGPIQLNSGESETISIPSNGSTWRLEMDQSTNYPFGQLVSAALEGCGINGNGAFSLGIINQFPLNDEPPFLDEDCVTNQGAYDPNDKQGIPLGIKDEHFIPKDQELEYLIRFQNTGTDTAFTVRIVDTLSANLDLRTLRIVGASNPYSYFLNGESTLQILFQNIMLPDSNVNEAASHGYVKYVVSPKKGLPNGTVIENEASIYFDFNAPVITNRTKHTLSENYVNISNVAFQPGIDISVYPNPATEETTVFLQSAEALSGQVSLYNMQGQLVLQKTFDSNRFKLNVQDLPSGAYMFRIETGLKTLGTGKLTITKG